jgi:uncharacterized protein
MKNTFIAILLVVVAALAWFILNKPSSDAIHEGGPAMRMDEGTETVEEKYHPVSLPALMAKGFDGRNLVLGEVLARTDSYTRYYITYESGELTISGIMNVPAGEGPFPVLILNHGHIDTAVYTNGRGLKREQDYLARQGYIVLHPDYRNHAQSDDDPDNEINIRLGYTEDVVNAVMAVKNSDYTFLDKERIGMLGHSMGGGIAQNVAVVRPDLVQAIVLFAPVSMDARDSFDRWTKSRSETAEQISNRYGSPQESPVFWDNVSAATFIDRVSAPVMLHHGTTDESVPLEWSAATVKLLEAASKNITFYTYLGEPHEFISAWPLVMQRTTEFFDKYVKGLNN